MARYIDADALKERLFAISVVSDDLYGMGINRGLDRAETAIDMMPTADVAPRAEVVLEVIGEVEKMARDYIDGIMLLDPQNPYCFGGINAFENVIKFLAGLKKKYTGGKDNEN